MSLTLEEALARVPQWAQARGLKTSFLAGGLTNKNYRVEAPDGEVFVLRLSGDNTERLGIQRQFEQAATQAAAAIGLAPEVIHVIQPEGYLITRFVNGRPLPPEEMRQPDNIRAVAAILRRVHALPPIGLSFSPFRVVEAYDQIAREAGVTAFPENYPELREEMSRIEAAFLKDPFTPCLCHNDLLNENFLVETRPGDPAGLRLLDWEYAGMGDPAFDLANFAVHHEFADGHDRQLLEMYSGACTQRQLARHKLMKIMSDFREAMWGVAQIGLSSLDYDFTGYARKHFARMTGNFSHPDYPAWLAAF